MTTNSPPSMPVTLIAFKAVSKNSLRGFARIRLGKSLIISDVPVLTSHGRAWAALPSKVVVDGAGTAQRDAEGKVRYTSILEWCDRETADRFSTAVVAAIRERHPDALEPEA